MGRRIEFLETLGRGGFGAVYLADVHGRDDFVQRLAVKVLSADMNLDADIAARQRDEARLLARLNHDHIVSVVDLTEVDGRPAVLMEYVEGSDAALLLRQGAIPVKAALQIAMAAASALDAAWSTHGRSGRPLRVIHRDIKPANLLVSRHGGVKVLDFGVARAEFDREGQTGSVQFGTARFMAPEQWLYGQASHKVDIYALGVCMVELLTGLHMERAPLAADAFDQHIAAVRGAVRQPGWGDELALDIDRLLARMLAFSPELRPTAAQVFEALADLVDHAPPPGLRRWAARAVPPCIEKRRQRWAGEPPPADGLLAGNTPAVAVAVQALEATTAPPASRSLAPTAPALPAPAADTLATALPGRSSRRLAPVVAGTAVAALVLIGGGLALPGLLDRGGDGASAAPAQAPPPPAGAAVGDNPAGATGPDSDDSPASDDGLEAAPDDVTAGTDAPPADASPRSRPSGDRSHTHTTTRSAPAPATQAEAPPADPQPDLAPASATPSPTGPSAAATQTAGVDDPQAPAGTLPPADTSAAPVPAPTPAADPTGSTAETGTPPAGTVVEPVAATVPISISSKPWGATLRVDGQARGTTPVRDLPLTAGRHTLTLRYGDVESSHDITVGGRYPTSHSWTVETDEWRSSR